MQPHCGSHDVAGSFTNVLGTAFVEQAWEAVGDRVDLVKIDGEYVVDLVDNPQDQVLVRALVQVCQAYGIHTVAEFVQDARTLRMLRELGVDYVQGYLIGRPVPVSQAGLQRAR